MVKGKNLLQHCNIATLQHCNKKVGCISTTDHHKILPHKILPLEGELEGVLRFFDFVHHNGFLHLADFLHQLLAGLEQDAAPFDEVNAVILLVFYRLG